MKTTVEESEKLKQLTCTFCGDVKDTCAEIVYSHGDKICITCKNKPYKILGDKYAFDMDMRLNNINR